MASEPQTVDRIESAANIKLTISTGVDESDDTQTSIDNQEDVDVLEDIPISRLDRTKDVEINEIREDSLKASGYSVTSISFSGSMMFKGDHVRTGDGNPKHLDDVVFDDEGVPTPVTISITHELSEQVEFFYDVLVTSSSYEVESESETETAYDWIAMDRQQEAMN